MLKCFILRSANRISFHRHLKFEFVSFGIHVHDVGLFRVMRLLKQRPKENKTNVICRPFLSNGDDDDDGDEGLGH